jgi:cell division septation protein DedD
MDDLAANLDRAMFEAETEFERRRPDGDDSVGDEEDPPGQGDDDVEAPDGLGGSASVGTVGNLSLSPDDLEKMVQARLDEKMAEANAMFEARIASVAAKAVLMAMKESEKATVPAKATSSPSPKKEPPFRRGDE